jgi:hypothetical protein
MAAINLPKMERYLMIVSFRRKFNTDLTTELRDTGLIWTHETQMRHTCTYDVQPNFFVKTSQRYILVVYLFRYINLFRKIVNCQERVQFLINRRYIINISSLTFALNNNKWCAKEFGATLRRTSKSLGN